MITIQLSTIDYGTHLKEGGFSTMEDKTTTKTTRARGKANRSTSWIEPKRNGGPTMTPKQAAKELGFKDVESVHILIRRGPWQDGLAGYIPTGKKWRIKNGSEMPGLDSMLYPEDVKAWALAHPIIKRQPVKIEYGEQEKQQVMAEAEKMATVNNNGVKRVNRKQLLIRLGQVHGIGAWNARTYKKLKQILDDEGIEPAVERHGIRRQYKVS